MRLVHQRLCREVLNRKITLWTVRESSVHPASFGYTGGLPLSKERTVRRRSADSPPVLGRIYQRQFQSGGSVKIQRRTVRQDTEDSPRLDRMVGSSRLDLYWMSLSLPSTKPHTSKSSLSFSLKHVGETTRSRLFGVVSGWFEHIPDSSQDCTSCPLGILTNP